MALSCHGNRNLFKDVTWRNLHTPVSPVTQAEMFPSVTENQSECEDEVEKTQDFSNLILSASEDVANFNVRPYVILGKSRLAKLTCRFLNRFLNRFLGDLDRVTFIFFGTIRTTCDSVEGESLTSFRQFKTPRNFE